MYVVESVVPVASFVHDGIGVNVVGGQSRGTRRIGGFTIGKGFSWLTDQYVLTSANVKSYELILPDGASHRLIQPIATRSCT
jgi:hypothetical protein